MTKKLSQNKKLAIAVLIVFMISFTSMVLFLDTKSTHTGEFSLTSVLDTVSHKGDKGEVNLSEVVEDNYFELNPLPSMMIDPEGRVENINSAFCRLVSMDCDQMLGELFYDQVNPKDLPGLVSINGKLYQSAESIEGAGPFRLMKGKDEVVVMLNAKPVKDEKGKVSHLLYTARDITEMVNDIQGEDQKPDIDRKVETQEQNVPKIKDTIMPEEQIEERLMVDKIGYHYVGNED